MNLNEPFLTPLRTTLCRSAHTLLNTFSSNQSRLTVLQYLGASPLLRSLHNAVGELSGELESWGAVLVLNVCDTGMTSLGQQSVASVHCHADVTGFPLRIMISEKEVGFFHESLTAFQVRRTSVCSLKTRIGLRTEQPAGLEALTLL